MKTINKRIAMFGIFAVVIYLVTVIIGSLLFKGYSNISQDISQLTATGSSTRELLNPLFLLYNLSVVAFGVGLFMLTTSMKAKIASTLIVAIGFIGALIWFFPIDLRGMPITSTGMVHIVLVSIVSLFTVIATTLFGFAYRKSDNLSVISTISFSAAALFLISGPIAAFGVTSPYAGLLERIPIGTFLIWILAVSIVIYKRQKSSK